MQPIDVNTGEVRSSNEKALLRSIAIGSCIAVASFDPVNKAGVIAHIMLPGKAPEKTRAKTKYAQDAIDEMMRLFREYGTDEKDVYVCLVGAGNVLKKDDDTVCQKNIDSVTTILFERGIDIKAVVLGGMERKSVFMDIPSGTVKYTQGNSQKIMLWDSKE
jgi:chemotaxis protein CheD